MTTFLLALTFAVNLDHTLRSVQSEIFRRCGDPSSRLFPPLVPIARGLPLAPQWHEADLDRLRKKNPLAHDAGDDPPPQDTIIENGVVRVPVSLLGWDRLRREGARLVGGDTREADPFFTAEPAIHFSWACPENADARCRIATLAGEVVADLPSTAAFWLTLLEIDHGPELWWDGCTYRIPYRRRLSVPR